MIAARYARYGGPEVIELVEQQSAGHAYRSQEGGWNNNGNDN